MSGFCQMKHTLTDIFRIGSASLNEQFNRICIGALDYAMETNGTMVNMEIDE